MRSTRSRNSQAFAPPLKKRTAPSLPVLPSPRARLEPSLILERTHIFTKAAYCQDVKVISLDGNVFTRPDGRTLAVPTVYNRWRRMLEGALDAMLRALEVVRSVVKTEVRGPKSNTDEWCRGRDSNPSHSLRFRIQNSGIQTVLTPYLTPSGAETCLRVVPDDVVVAVTAQHDMRWPRGHRIS
ncbi:MAG: hypothetical protein WAL77_01455, partial [Candidatus Dormiibacterota bacterium]